MRKSRYFTRSRRVRRAIARIRYVFITILSSRGVRTRYHNSDTIHNVMMYYNRAAARCHWDRRAERMLVGGRFYVIKKRLR